MPVYDHRVFRNIKEWWIAQVHVSSGSVSKQGEREMYRDEVIFTCITDHSLKSRKAEIQSGKLCKIKHNAIKEMLNSAEETDERFEMHPYNAPHEPKNEDGVYSDNKGTRWLLRQSILFTFGPEHGRQKHHAVEVICLDDSAVKGTIGMADQFTFSHFVNTWGDEAKEQIIGLVNEKYIDLEEAMVKRGSSRKYRAKIDPLQLIADESEVIFGTKTLPITNPVIFAVRDLPYRGTRYTISCGIKDGSVFAGTKPVSTGAENERCEALELAIISAIEKNPDHAFVMSEVFDELKSLE